MDTIFALVIGASLGLITYASVVRPLAVATCLIESEACVLVRYKKKGSTVLIEIPTSNVSIWFDGKDALLYGEPTGKTCDGKWESVYVFDLSLNRPRGYLCAEPLKDVDAMYHEIPWSAFPLRTEKTLNMVDVINAFIDQDIISI